MNGTLVIEIYIQPNAQMRHREQLQLVTGQKLTPKYYQFHCKKVRTAAGLTLSTAPDAVLSLRAL